MAKVQYGDGSFQSQTQSPSSNRATRRSSVAASVVWEPLKRKGAQPQRGSLKAASLSRLCCRSKIPIRNRRTSSEHFADHILGIRRRFFFHHLHVYNRKASVLASISAYTPIVTRVPWQHFQLVRMRPCDFLW